MSDATALPNTALIKTDKELVDILLPSINTAELTTQEKANVDRLNSALTILGPAAGGALVCPGNQEHTPDDEKCPWHEGWRA